MAAQAYNPNRADESLWEEFQDNPDYVKDSLSLSIIPFKNKTKLKKYHFSLAWQYQSWEECEENRNSSDSTQSKSW